MEIVDSYVKEVAQYLPPGDRAEIAEDLFESLAEEVQAEAEQAGRDATADDEYAVVARFGHPYKAAARYLPQRYLIGPTLYPAFLRTLKVVWVVALAALVLMALGAAQVQGWTLGPMELVWTTVELLFWATAAVLGVFVALEAGGERLDWYERWSPRKHGLTAIGVPRAGDVATNLVTEGIFLLWWNDVVVLTNVLPVLDAGLMLAPVWDTYFWPLNIVFGACFALHLYVLLKGLWQWSSQVLEIVLNAALLGLGVVLLAADVLVVVAPADALSGEALRNVDRIVRASVLVIGAITVWDMWLGLKVLWGNPAASLAAARSDHRGA